jgi:NitT/TauT family transport system substrate-binding protein
MIKRALASLVLSLAFLGAAAALRIVGAEQFTSWRHGNVVPKGDAGFFYMAAEGGFASAQGLDLKMFAFQNDTLMLKALLAGELDSYEGSPISPTIAGSKGADVKILGCSWPKLTYSFFSRGDIGSIADLKGRNVGISAPGSLPDFVARAMLRRSGLSPDDVKFVMAGGDPDRVRAIVAGTIDAAIATSDFAARSELGLKTLARAGEVLPQFLRVCVITRGDVVRGRSEALVRFLAAEMNALHHALAQRDAVVVLARRIAGLSANDPTPEANFTEVNEQSSVSPTLDIDHAKFSWLRDLLAEDGRLDARFDPSALIDGSPREQALRRAGLPR